VAPVGEREVRTGVRWGDLMKRGHLENVGLDGRIILKYFFMKWDVK
jgi:hypothetical protein